MSRRGGVSEGNGFQEAVESAGSEFSQTQSRQSRCYDAVVRVLVPVDRTTASASVAFNFGEPKRAKLRKAHAWRNLGLSRCLSILEHGHEGPLRGSAGVTP